MQKKEIKKLKFKLSEPHKFQRKANKDKWPFTTLLDKVKYVQEESVKLSLQASEAQFTHGQVTAWLVHGGKV